MSIIKIENMSFSYTNSSETLTNINMEINEGEFVAIIGENGSGKSSLIKCILGLNKVQKGKITVKNRIGYLPQMTEIQNYTLHKQTAKPPLCNTAAVNFYTFINPRPSATEKRRMRMMHTGAIYLITTVKSFFALKGPLISTSSIRAFGLMI